MCSCEFSECVSVFCFCFVSCWFTIRFRVVYLCVNEFFFQKQKFCWLSKQENYSSSTFDNRRVHLTMYRHDFTRTNILIWSENWNISGLCRRCFGSFCVYFGSLGEEEEMNGEWSENVQLNENGTVLAYTRKPFNWQAKRDTTHSQNDAHSIT